MGRAASNDNETKLMIKHPSKIITMVGFTLVVAVISELFLGRVTFQLVRLWLLFIFLLRHQWTLIAFVTSVVVLLLWGRAMFRMICINYLNHLTSIKQWWPVNQILTKHRTFFLNFIWLPYATTHFKRSLKHNPFDCPL